GMTCSSTQAASYELNAAQNARLQQYLPRTFMKLARRDPVHAVCIGDSVMVNWSYGADNGNVLKAWNGIFLQELADQFIYNGGVRLVRPAKGQPAKLTNFIGPEITVQNFSRGGRQIFHALQPLTTTAFENNPDLVIVSYGINDCLNGQPLDVYRKNVQQVVETVKAHGADLILCGPSLILSDPPELNLGLTRPYTDTMREVAQANGVFFADLGDLAWLIELEQRQHPLDEVKKRLAKEAAKAAEAAAAAAAAAKADPKAPAPAPAPAPPKPLLENPLAEELNTDPDKKAMVSFQQIVDLLKHRFNHGDIVDLVHPDTPSQALLGRRVFMELINGAKSVPWTMQAATVNLENAETCKLTYRLENPTDKDQTYAVLPLLTPMWTPQDAPSQVALKPGKKTLVNITYKRTPPATTQGRSDLFPPHEPVFRLPILTAGGGMARIEEARANITPVSVLWNTGAMFNQQGIELGGTIVNPGTQVMVGKWEASWMGQKATGTFSATAGEQEPFRVKFNIPPTTRQKGTVTFQVTIGSTSYRFDRELEVVRNISLKESVPLLSPATYLRDQVQNPLMPDTTSPGVVLRADADSNALYLTCDIYGYRLQDSP
ncbi:MAG TPA: SGNH/GDSL hydrolase family protein, partial [Candidatus Saccharimonadia bacterium]|nr:SGNH/GDSL hydrolase family protein [Candidatus Saccharimonadia bacterium]